MLLDKQLIRAWAATIATELYEDGEEWWSMCHQVEDYIAHGSPDEPDQVIKLEIVKNGKRFR